MGSITKETRRESYEKLESTSLRQNILDTLSNGVSLTAKDIAVILHDRHLIPYPVRQAVAPRLTELVEEGLVEAWDKAFDIETGRTVAVYRLVDK